MAEKTLKCYGMYIDVAEVILNIPSGKMDDLLSTHPLVGVYQDPDGQRQVLIYAKKEYAKEILDKARSLGFTSAVLCPTMIYVLESDVKNKDVIADCEEESLEVMQETGLKESFNVTESVSIGKD